MSDRAATASILGCASIVWDNFLDFKRPAFLPEPSDPKRCASLLAAVIPLFALTAGALLWLAGRMFFAFFRPTGGALLFALLCIGVLEFKDSLRGSSLVVLVFRSRILGEDLAGTLRFCSDPLRVCGTPGGAVCVGLLVAFRFLLLGMTAYCGSIAWIIVVLTGAFTAQGILAAPLLGIGNSGKRKLVLVAGIIALAFFFAHPVGVAAGCAVVWLIVREVRSMLDGRCGADQVTFAGAFAELCLLLLGVLLA